MAFPASCSRDRILGSALEAYLEEQPALLCNLFLCRICDWHFYYFNSTEGSFLPFCSYYFAGLNKTITFSCCCYPTTVHALLMLQILLIV
jgi:hypothetical protein